MLSQLNFKVLKQNITNLPFEFQKEVIDFVDFLKFKNKKVEEDILTDEEKSELNKRILFAKKNPEKLLTKKDAIKKLEKSLGRKIQIKS